MNHKTTQQISQKLKSAATLLSKNKTTPANPCDLQGNPNISKPRHLLGINANAQGRCSSQHDFLILGEWYPIDKNKSTGSGYAYKHELLWCVIVTQISAFKKSLRYSRPRSPISTSVLLKQIQGRISPPVCSCAEPKAHLQLQFGSKRSRKVIHPPTLHPGSHFSARAHHLWQLGALQHRGRSHSPTGGTFGDISTATNREWIWIRTYKRWRLTHPRWLLVLQIGFLLLPRLLHVNSVLKKI